MVVMSKQIEEYFFNLDKNMGKCFDIANDARKKGFDPDDEVDILIAKDMAERVEGLISTIAPQIRGKGIVFRIKELERKYGAQDWRVALLIAEEVAKEKFCKFKDKKEAMEVGIRVGIAYVTNGVVASPLEGFVRLELKDRKDGKGKFFSLYFSGPIRSAGGTGASVSVLIADYVRMKMGYLPYDPTEKEIKRFVTELYDYHERVTNLQYLPSEEEIEFLGKHLPVQINGDASEKFEVSQYKDLDRIETNTIRNGVCLVLGEGIAQKSPKLWKKIDKWGKDFDLKQWLFLEKFVKLQKKIKAKQKGEEKKDEKISPDYTFIKDLVAGRPVFTHPLAKGGFRLRYGRCRTSGFSMDSIHPATMVILDGFIAIGTQLKMERPGKAAAISSCDTIEGPIVKLKNGGVVFVESEEIARKIVDEVEEIIYLGDILINYGDFLDRAHPLVPCGYNEEWWKAESKIDKDFVSIDEAISFCKLGKPLYPRYTFHWNAISIEQLISLVEWVKKGSVDDEKIVLPYNFDVNLEVSDVNPKRALELLGVPHRVVVKEHVVIEGEWAKALKFSLGSMEVFEAKDALDLVCKMSGFLIKDKEGTYIGARMGRPEKSKMRKLIGSPQVLFPVGNEGGRMRSFQSALEKGNIKSQFPIMYCKKCSSETIYRVCENCGERTSKKYFCPICGIIDEKCNHDKVRESNFRNIDIHHYFDKALELLGTRHYPELIKGVRGTINESHIPEHLLKGILRAINGLYVNKDGTIRYDMSETAITHFKPKEIRASISKLKEMGYVVDIYGKELVDKEQIVEIKPQDIILPSCPETLDEKADELLFKVAKFVDQELVKLYGMDAFYNLKTEEDLIGHLVLAMSPHTSAAIVGRIIGFSATQGFLTHPYFHSIMRRDCDGDEAGIMLLMDGLLNFSKKYLPSHRGARQDEPLVVSSMLIPAEVDDMVFNMDVVSSYPLELYEAALEYKMPWEVKIDIIANHLGTERQYQGFGFTHDTSNINAGVRCSSYKSIPTMKEKVEKQMAVAEKLRAVDESDVARLVIERHFVRDIKGNLRKFSMQQFRCVNCNKKFRRPPLNGYCSCGGRIIFTIAEGSVVKYLEPSISLAKKYNLPAYLRQTLELTKERIESVFGKDKEKQEGLGKWFG